MDGGRRSGERPTSNFQRRTSKFRIDPDAILILDVFEKKTRQTRIQVMDNRRPRVAKMEKGDPTVSVDLPLQALFRLGLLRKELARAM